MRPSQRRAVCIFHDKDVDGVSSAALVRAARETDLLPADYGDMIAKLRSVSRADEVYILDLGLSEGIRLEFLGELQRISGFAEVHYIDHHPLREGTKRRIRALGVDLLHSIRECAGVLVYSKFSNVLPDQASFLACMAAVTDYLDDRPLARRLIERQDRQLVLLEATSLSYALARRADDPDFLLGIVDRLSRFAYPHEIPDVWGLALEHAEKMVKLRSFVEIQGRKLGDVAYLRTEEASTGMIANLLIGAFDAPVGLAYRLKEGGKFCEISLRGSGECRKHLGKMAEKLSIELGGFGGGHARASGARIPADTLDSFLTMLSRELSN